MSDAVISLMLAAGISGITYTRLGRRIGYSNSSSVFKILVIVFIITFIVILTLLEFVLNIT
jgi:hypothetical protein